MQELLLMAGMGKGVTTVEGQYLVGGTHSWEVPQKVYELSAVAIGRGQDGDKITTKGGDAGDLRWIKTFPVTPGEIIRFEMDIDATILRSDGTVILRAASGLPNSRPSTPIDLANGIGGGDGGRGGDPQGSPIGGAGGGTGGYNGNGGDGYPYPNLIPEAGSGAAAGGQNYSEGGAFFGFGGGGVGIFGVGGTATSPGGGGSGGETATFVQGGFYGGGGGTRYAPNNNEYYNGAAGVIRLVWGPDRFYPDSNLQDV